MLFRHGLNAVQVQLWLGHHSPAFTIATYVHLLPEDLPDAAFLDADHSIKTTDVNTPLRSSHGGRASDARAFGG
jgi:hypothetical protein